MDKKARLTMFVRKKYFPMYKKTAVQIVETYRSQGKVKQRIVKHIGVARNDRELKELLELAEGILLELIQKRQPTVFSSDQLQISQKEAEVSDKRHMNVNLASLREEKRVINGIGDIYGKVYEQVGFGELFGRKHVTKRIIKDLVLARIASPKSKLSTVEMLARDFGVEYNVHQVYRALDALDDKMIEKIKNQTYEYTKSLFPKSIEVIFYDCTTLYFESFSDDELRSFGFSKDNKHNQVQVVLGLAVTKEGLPIGYDLFPGNFYEGHTLKKFIEQLKNHYKIDRAVFVADSGMLNKINISLLKNEGIEFIVAARLKSLPQEQTEKIFNKELYKDLSSGEGNQKSDTIKYLELAHSIKGKGVKIDNLRLIVTYSQKRAKKDQYDREKAVEKLEKRLSRSKDIKSFLSNQGHKRYLKIEGENNVEIDKEKIEESERWDGLHGVITNIKDMSVSEVLSHYSGLWQVEESFRIHKHDLLIRPIFHWTPRRIKAHIAIVYMSFSLIRFLQHHLRKNGLQLSSERIRNELIHVQTSILKHQLNGTYYAIPSKPSDYVERIYSIFGLKYRVTPYKIVA